MPVHTITDVRLVISEFTKDDALNCLYAVGLPQLYVDQLQIMRGHIENTVLIVP
jgi:hypothetical protein